MKKLLTLLPAFALCTLMLGSMGCAHSRKTAAVPTPPAAEVQPEFVQLTLDNIVQEVVLSEIPVLVYVCHKDSGACKLEEPMLRKVAVKYKGRVKFARVDAAENPHVAALFGASSMQDLPYHLFIKAGDPRGDYAGLLNDEELGAVLDKLIALKVAPAKPADEPSPAPGH